jgi:hypothetical protein
VALGVVVASVGAATAASGVAHAAPASQQWIRHDNGTVTPPSFGSYTLATGSSTTRTKPDDIATLGGLVYVAFANGVNKETGAPGPLGPNSAIAAYSSTGQQVAAYAIAGKCDGLTADVANNRLLATVNEDGNTSLCVIHPGNPTPVHLSYTPDSYGLNPSKPGTLGGPGIDKDVRGSDPNPQGGTDAIVIFSGAYYVSTSNPTDNTQPVLGSLIINEAAGTATVKAALLGDQTATPINANDPNASAGALNIADPDSNAVVPAGVPAVGGSLALVGEGDREIAFTSSPGSASGASYLSVGAALGDLAFPTSPVGTLYIVDPDLNTVFAVTSTSWVVNSMLAASPIKDNNAQAGGFVGVVDLATGNVSPLISGLKSPAGLLFVPGPSPQGYWEVASDGGIFPFGNAGGLGSTGAMTLNQPIVGMAATPDGSGYWLVAADGGIFPFGSAQGFGSHGGSPLNKPIVGMASTPAGDGYWLVATDGGIFPYGKAAGFGSTGNLALSKPIVGMAVTPDGGGYWLIASDGGIFPFGDAKGLGSLGGTRLSAPIVGLAATPDGSGYWMVGSDGNVYPFGTAHQFGGTSNVRLTQAIVGMSVTRTGLGYWLTASDGGLFPFGDAEGIGSEGGTKLTKPIVDIVTTG